MAQEQKYLQQVHIVLCSQLKNRWAAQICVVLSTRYNLVWRFFNGLPLKMTSQWRHISVCESFWWRHSTKHTKQHDISRTLADCYINCTVYNDLQLFYKEKVKKISFIPKGLPIVNRWKFVANRLYVQQKVHSDRVLYLDFNPLNKFLLTLFVIHILSKPNKTFTLKNCII